MSLSLSAARAANAERGFSIAAASSQARAAAAAAAAAAFAIPHAPHHPQKHHHQVRSIHWSPYDRVRVVNADP